MVFKPIVAAGALALLSIVPAAAQPSGPDQLPTTSVASANITVVASCEAQMRRLAGISKVIGANAAHVDEVCGSATGGVTP
jgi:hypothetical protein